MSIQRRGSSWRASYHGPDGRQRSKSFQRKGDAERWLSQQRSFIVQGDWTDPARGRITFGEYAARLAGLARTDLKPKTRHQYKLAPDPVHPADLADRAPGESHLRGPDAMGLPGSPSAALAPRGIRQSVFVMSAALDHAVRSGRIRTNPARGLGLPRPQRRDYVFLTHRQVLGLAVEAGPLAAPGPGARLHGPALGRGHRPARLRRRFRPPPHRCPARLLRRRRARGPGHPEIAPGPDCSGSRVRRQ